MPAIHESTNMRLTSTSEAAKGQIQFGTSCYDEATNRLGLLTTTPSHDLSLGGEADFVIQQERESTAATAGRHARLQAGGAKSGSTDKDGGNLTLSGGIATGSGTSRVYVRAAPAGSTGTTDSAPATVAEFRGSGTVCLGLQGALLAQGATSGFVTIPAVATGDPNGTPVAVPTGQVPITFCPTTGKLAVWDGSAWKFFSADA